MKINSEHLYNYINEEKFIKDIEKKQEIIDSQANEIIKCHESNN